MSFNEELVGGAKKRSPKKSAKSPSKRTLPPALKRWSAAILKVTGSRRPITRDDPAYAKVMKIYRK